jgi:putative MFS transporter
MDHIGSGWAQFIPVWLSGAFFMAEGAELQIINASAEVLRPVWGLSTNVSSMMVSVVMCGFLIGTITSGLVSDVFGRRPAILMGYIGTGLFGALPATTSSFGAFLTFRFLNGIACGIGVVTANNYIGEMSATRLRMYLMVLGGGLFYALGEIYACTLIMIYMPNLTESAYWRRLSILGTAPAWIHVLPCYFLLPESAAWQCSVGKVTEAAKTLCILGDRTMFHSRSLAKI